MSIISKTTGVALAFAAASLIGCAGSGGSGAEGASAKVHCFGINKCKGHNDCKTAHNACKGHGSCKGKGFVGMSKKACDDAGGKPG